MLTPEWQVPLDTSPLRRVDGSIAVLISGALGLGSRPTDALSFRRFVVAPLSGLSTGSVAVFACLDDNATRFALEAAAWRETRGVFVDTRSSNQLERLRDCFKRSQALPEDFALYVRVRPDATWFAPLTVTTLDAISVRGRILFVPAGHSVPEQVLSWKCQVFRGPARCSLLDDQFALVPAQFRESYFLGRCAPPTRPSECSSYRDALEFAAYQESNITERVRSCEIPVRIVASPQHLRSALMPTLQQQQRYDHLYAVGPRWGNCTARERRVGLTWSHRGSSATSRLQLAAASSRLGVRSSQCKYYSGLSR